MKKSLLTFLAMFCIVTVFGQVTDQNIKDKILNDIQASLENKTKALDETVNKLDEKVTELDKAIAKSNNASLKADKLLERVQSLEKRQSALEENEINVYQANYQSAVINLVSMEREIKPLMLFNTTRDFFTSLNETSNPLNYPGYRDWFKSFNQYVEKEKKKDAGLNVLSSLLSLTGNLTKVTPLAGPLVQPFFTGISSYVNTLKKDEKEESEKMYLITAKIAQFTHDKDNVEHEWTSITKELDELQKHYTEILNQNTKLLGIKTADFKTKFSKENDANKRYNYLTFLRQQSGNFVAEQKKENPKDWKEGIYFQLMEVQSLKLRFGRITFKISENIDSYRTLIAKYKADPEIGMKVASLETKLNELKETFDRAFEPIDYINSATRMYKVH